MINITHHLAVLQQYDSLRIVSWILGPLGLFANIFVIGWMIYNKFNPLKLISKNSVRNVSNNPSLLMIFNLAVADLLGALYLIILAISDQVYRISDGELNENGTYDNTWIISTPCFVERILSQISLLMSIFIICLITVSRFIPVVYPYSTWEINIKKTRIALISFWIVSIAISVVGAVESLLLARTKPSHYSILGHLCQLEAPQTLILQIAVYGELIIGVVAYLIVVILYIIILLKLRKARSVTVSNQKRSVENKIHIIILWIIFTNVVFWIPITCLTIFDGVTNFISERFEIVPVLVLLLFSNTVINPFVYLAVGTCTIIKRQRQVTTLVQNLSWRGTTERKNNSN